MNILSFFLHNKYLHFVQSFECNTCILAIVKHTTSCYSHEQQDNNKIKNTTNLTEALAAAAPESVSEPGKVKDRKPLLLEIN